MSSKQLNRDLNFNIYVHFRLACPSTTTKFKPIYLNRGSPEDQVRVILGCSTSSTSVVSSWLFEQGGFSAALLKRDGLCGLGQDPEYSVSMERIAV